MTPDQIIDRRRMKRRVTFWRIISLLLLIAVVIGLLSAAGVFESFGKKQSNHIARVSISGVITNDKPLLDLLDDLKDEDQVKAVILDISSPGGSTVGGEAIYEAVLALAKEKPVVTSVGTLAASAGYMIAAASDHIVARRSSIVGSIGVIFQYGQVSGLLEKIGVEVNEIKSAPLKAEPSPFHETTPEAKAMIDRLVQDTYNWFVGIVAERRGFSDFKARQLADGSIFTGSQGLENGLIDAIGDQDTAKEWLVAEKELSDDLEVLTWKPVRPSDSLFTNPAGIGNTGIKWIANAMGLDPAGQSIEAMKEALPQRLFLDGLISMLQIDGGDEK
ncbi:MAG: signal peptide peptidase SppA [Salaquimonas sp.]